MYMQQLQVMPRPESDRLWDSTLLHFITDLLPANGFDSVLVVVDWLHHLGH